MPAPTRFYYGWVMVALAAAAMVGTMPGRTFYLGLIAKPLTADPAFGLDDARFSGLNFWAVLLGSALCLPVGRLIDRLGVRVMLAAVAAGLGASAVWMATVTDQTSLFVALVLVRGLGQGALSVVALAMVGKWFTRRLGVAMGLLTVLLTVGLAGGAAWLAQATAGGDWRGPWAAVGWVLLLGLAPVGLLLARSTPEAVGVTPDGPVAPGDRPPLDLPAGRAVRSRAFWVVTVSGAVFNLMISAVTLFPARLLESRGLPADADALTAFQGATFVAGLPANLIGGWLARRMPLGKLLAAGMLALAASLAVFPLVTTTGTAVGYAALLGVSGGLVTVVYFAAYGTAFGRRELGLIQAVAQVVTVFASALGPVLLTASQTATGSYDPLFLTAAAVSAGLAAVAWGTRPPDRV